MEIAYVKCGDYYIPDLTLPEETRSIGKWGRMHREYLKATHPITYTNLILSGKLWTYLADLNEQAQLRLDTLVSQMKDAEGITEALKARFDAVTVHVVCIVVRFIQKGQDGISIAKIRRFIGDIAVKIINKFLCCHT